MGDRIWVLPEELANRIAAGEVVERPASVVKELIENAIDARVQSLLVEILDSGKQLIRVEDDGRGMERDDALLAFERHATSKIHSSEDLRSVRTLGFRGEALPSIAAVSRLRLFTAVREGSSGTLIELEGGTLKRVEEVARAAGTTVEVRRLFFNTPARLKFLKSSATELNHIHQIVTQVALAHPHLRLRMVHESRVLIQVPSDKDIHSRLVALWGSDFVRDLLPLELQDPYLRAIGFISTPSSSRGSSGHQHFFINSRSVRNRLLSRAVAEAYGPFLPRGRYPIAFLFLDLDPREVDVNVHPAKVEVRLAREGKVQGLLQEAIRKTLSDHQRQSFSLSGAPSPSSASVLRDAASTLNLSEQEILSQEETRPEPGLPEESQVPLRFPFREREGRRWIPIGQIQNSFILLETPEALLVLDQHAAHERVLYEELKEKLSRAGVPQQSLLGTVSLTLTRSETLLLCQHLAKLERLGFVLEPFGGETFLIRAVPISLVGQDYEGVLRDMVDKLAEWGKVGGLEEVLEEMIRVIACHGAIKVPQPLQTGQIQSLVERIQELGPPYTCPHGRPILQSFTLDTIKKGFLRNR